MNSSVPQIGLAATALSLLPVLAAGVFLQRWCGQGRLLAWATARMLIQLFGIGFILVYLFETPDPRLGAVVLAVMIGVSAWIARRTVKRPPPHLYLAFVTALAASGLPVLALDLLIVQAGELRYLPRFFIPLAGMVFGNAMNSLSLAAERFESERERSASFTDARRTAFNAAMIPQINTFLSVGMVSLPGMMTGQILAGVSPLIAVRYQVLIMGMVLGSAALTVAVYFLLCRAGSGRAVTRPTKR